MDSNEVLNSLNMKNLLKTNVFLATLFATFSIQAQHTEVINSNRPGESQSAFSVGQTVFQVESGAYRTLEEHSLLDTKTNGFGLDLAFRYGAFFEQLEFNVELKHQWDRYQTGINSADRSDFKKIILGAKYLIYDPYKNYDEKIDIKSWKAKQKFKWRQLIPAIGVYAGANLNFDSVYLPQNEPSISPKVMLITQNQFSGGYVLVMNFVADRITSDFPSFGYVVTVTKGFNDRWSGFIENQGLKSDFYSDSVIRTGAAYLLQTNIQVDASIGFNFKDTPSILVGGLGLSWRFDENYKPVIVRVGKKDKEKDKEKDKKDKKDKKDQK